MDLTKLQDKFTVGEIQQDAERVNNVMDKKWEAVMEEGSNGYTKIFCAHGEICTFFQGTIFNITLARYIAALHNQGLGAKAMKKEEEEK